MKTVFATLAWITGICMSGVDGPIYINLIGLAIFMLSSRVIAKEIKNA